jgi:hypothetical protein
MTDLHGQMGGLLRFFDDERFESETLSWATDEEMAVGN